MTDPHSPDPAPDGPPAGPVVDVAACGRLLRRIEAVHDAAGWDRDNVGSMTVYVVYDHHEAATEAAYQRTWRSAGAPVRTARYTAQPMLSPTFFVAAGIAPWQALGRFAHAVAFVDQRRAAAAGDFDVGALGEFRRLLHAPGLIGFAACYEEVGRRTGDRADFLATVRSRDVGAYPDALEGRRVVMIDVDNVGHQVTRRRGEPAELILGIASRGDISTPLRVMVDLARDQLPADQAGYDSRYPNIADAAARGLLG